MERFKTTIHAKIRSGYTSILNHSVKKAKSRILYMFLVCSIMEFFTNKNNILNEEEKKKKLKKNIKNRKCARANDVYPTTRMHKSGLPSRRGA